MKITLFIGEGPTKSYIVDDQGHVVIEYRFELGTYINNPIDYYLDMKIDCSDSGGGVIETPPNYVVKIYNIMIGNIKIILMGLFVFSPFFLKYQLNKQVLECLLKLKPITQMIITVKPLVLHRSFKSLM